MIGKNYNLQRNFRTLLSLIFLDQTYITITFPLVTLIFFDTQSHLFSEETTLATRSLWYGLCVSLPNFINMFFAPLLSALSDQLGRKKLLIIEIFSAAFFTLCVGFGIFLGKIAFVFLGFLIRGAFSRTNPTALAMIGDMAPRDKKILYMGYLQFAISVGAFLGPILGGFFAHSFFFSTLNFALPFFIASFLSVCNSIFAVYFIEETLQKNVNRSSHLLSLQMIKEIVTHKEVLRISLLLLLIQISWSTYYQFIPPILKTIDQVDSQQLGWFIGMIAFWLALATSVGVKWLDRLFNVHQMLICALYLILIGLVITFLAASQLLPYHHFFMWLSAFPVAAGDVISYSCLTALYSNAVAHEKQGKVMGICFIMSSSAWALTGFFGGFLMSISPLLPLIFAPISLFFALSLLHTTFGKKLALNEVG